MPLPPYSVVRLCAKCIFPVHLAVIARPGIFLHCPNCISYTRRPLLPSRICRLPNQCRLDLPISGLPLRFRFLINTKSSGYISSFFVAFLSYWVLLYAFRSASRSFASSVLLAGNIQYLVRRYCWHSWAPPCIVCPCACLISSLVKLHAAANTIGCTVS